jgi:hypothetical protein
MIWSLEMMSIFSGMVNIDTPIAAVVIDAQRRRGGFHLQTWATWRL